MKPIKIVAAKKNKKNDQKTISKLWKKYPNFGRQIVVSIGPMLITLTSGMTFSFTGTLLPSIREYVDEYNGSWLVSVNVLCMAIGGLVSPFVSQRLGKKRSLLLGNVLSFLGWLALSAASHLFAFIVGCAVVGFSSGFSSNVAIPYQIEIPERRLRGPILALNSTCNIVGILVGHLVGLLLPWRNAMRASSVVPVLSLLFMLLSPESPSWLMHGDRLDEAKVIFFWLRGVNAESEEEFDMLLNKHMLDVGWRKRGLVHSLASRKFLVPFFILAIMFAVQVGTGGDFITFFVIDMLHKLSPKMDARGATILIDLVTAVFCVVSCFLMKKVSRRLLFFASAAGTVVALLGVIAVLTFELPNIVLILCLCAYTASLNMGIVPVTWLSLGEIYPEVTRDVGVTLSVLYYSFMTFVLVKTVPLVIRCVNMLAALYLFVGLVFVFSFILYFIMPETKECTLQQVEEEVCKTKLFQKKPIPIN